MRERQLIDAIHRRLPKTLHKQSMTSASLTHNGTPDYYYDGSTGDLWVEYKQLKAMPRNGMVEPFVLLTEHQQRWILRRYKIGGNARIVVGLPNKAAVLAIPKEGKFPADNALSYDEIAKWICEFCGCS